MLGWIRCSGGQTGHDCDDCLWAIDAHKDRTPVMGGGFDDGHTSRIEQEVGGNAPTKANRVPAEQTRPVVVHYDGNSL